MKVIVASLLMMATAWAEKPWTQIVGESQGTIPPSPGGEVVWRTDFLNAVNEARKNGRPILVTWRCIPCKQCAAFDKNVLEGSPKLTPLLQRFVPLRMTDAAQLDHRVFPYRGFQDLDLSWWAYFMNAEGQVYGVFGGKDHVSDATRISEAAFVNSLQRVLAHHYDPRRKGWDIDGPRPNMSVPEDSPKTHRGYKLLSDKRPHMAKQSCVHCHQVADIENEALLQSGKFDMQAFKQRWPFPENVGLEVDRDHGLRINKVEVGSAASKIGMQPGDVLAMAGNRKLFGQADFRGVLHRSPVREARIIVGWTRNDRYMQDTLILQGGWRDSPNYWRKSVYDGVVGYGLGFFPLKGPRQGKGQLSVRPFMGKNAQQNPWWKSGLRPNMEIVEVNGRKDDWNSRQLLAWFKLNHQKGDSVEVKTSNGKTFKATLPVQR